MAYSIYHDDVRPRKLFRSRRHKVISGLCGGMAEHFGLSLFWLRVGMIAGTVLTFPVVPILYLIAVFIVPLEPTSRAGAYQRHEQAREQIPTFRTQEEALDYLNHQFDRIEDKVRRMEDHVTSKEYVLRRKFENL